MPRPSPAETPPDASAEQHGAPDESLYDVPAELLDTDFEAIEEPSAAPARAPSMAGRKLAVGLALLAVMGGSLLAYRANHRRAVLATGTARASDLLRLDTAASYRDAAVLLEPLAELDPLEAGSLRAYALAMLFADYREQEAETSAEALLVEPSRAEEVPRHANLAIAALALGRREAGNAMTAAARAGATPEAQLLQARVAFLAGNLSAAVDPVLAAAERGLPAALALQGDLLRRTRQDPARARAAYGAALDVSPLHPRATYGLAKLALGGQASVADAATALRRLAADAGTPAPERARAALYLAAFRLRDGAPIGARAALDAAALDRPARAWADRAAAVLAAHRGAYRAVEGAPGPVRSASDDDPPELPAMPPAPEPRPATPAPAPVTTPSRRAAQPSAATKAAAAKKSVRAPAKRSAASTKRSAASTKRTRARGRAP
jgi:hypothetical protein